MRTFRYSTCCGLAAAVAAGLAVTSPAVAHVQLNTPNGGEVLDAGSVFTVEWDIMIGHDLQNWDLWYSTTSSSGPWIDIAMDLPPGERAVGSVHTYDWTIPNILSDDTWTRVRMDNTGTDYYDVSDASFIIVPGPQPGDFDNSGVLDMPDIDLLTAEVMGGGSDLAFDLDGDGEVNQEDRRVWVEDLKGTFFGDSDLDGKVGASDLNNLGVNWQIATATSWEQGDFNGDGSVLAGDLNSLGTNWQKGVAAAVPEPSSLVLALGQSMLFGLGIRKRRTRRTRRNELGYVYVMSTG